MIEPEVMDMMPEATWICARTQIIAEVRRLTAENARMREVIAEALEPGMFGDQHVDRPAGIDPRETEIAVLCERFGYGCVMDCASRLWGAKDNIPKGGNHTVAACASVRKAWCDDARKVLGAVQ